MKEIEIPFGAKDSELKGWEYTIPEGMEAEIKDGKAKLCSNEWSEEEYGRLFDIEHYLDGTLQLNPDRKIACIDFLKSLRPSWKPSEEQIYSLGTVVKGYDECTVGSVGYNLKELYEQLKKLI